MPTRNCQTGEVLEPLSLPLVPVSRQNQTPGWSALLIPLAILVVLGGLLPLACTLLRISGAPGIVAAFIDTSARYLTVAWIVLVGASILAEKIVGEGLLQSEARDHLSELEQVDLCAVCSRSR
jgi:hypothetical protein